MKQNLLPAYLMTLLISDELLHVVVDGTAFLHGCHYGREVIISQHHLC